ncbi:hypothetical protein, partial [Photobacterium damselae]|uniref:hypothetical protein n=1 Tax=Photobacterium damselae TaxID=38293 RepID=UPI001ADE4562
ERRLLIDFSVLLSEWLGIEIPNLQVIQFLKLSYYFNAFFLKLSYIHGLRRFLKLSLNIDMFPKIKLCNRE